jgi:thiosulfate reductase cytochrome b subunit
MQEASHPEVPSAGVSVKEDASPQATRLVIRKHHALVRWTHWLNIPLLIGLILSGMSIYWASPVYQHKPHPTSGNFDYLADVGIWLCAHLPGLSHYSDPPNWIYNHFSLGPWMLSQALRLHWLFAYLFMFNGLLYLVGLALGGGYRALLPRLTDMRDALSMIGYYAGLFFAKVARRAWPHPEVTTKYNALQRLSYFAMPVAGTLAIPTGWAIHKPMQLDWLAALFGGYDTARIWHFWLMGLFLVFVVPHVILIFADGWDTLRSMVTGWSKRAKRTANGQ